MTALGIGELFVLIVLIASIVLAIRAIKKRKSWMAYQTCFLVQGMDTRVF